MKVLTKLGVGLILAVAIQLPSQPQDSPASPARVPMVLATTQAKEPVQANMLEEYEREVRAHPDSSEAHFNLGLAYLELPYSSEKAVRAFDRAIKLKPDYSEAYNGLGWAHLDLCSYYGLFLYKETIDGARNAIKAFQQAIKLNPGYIESYLGMGIAHSILTEYQKALEAYQHIIQIKPEYADVYSYAAQANMHLGNYERAIELLKGSIRITSSGLRNKPEDVNNNPPCTSQDIFEDYLNLARAYNKLNQPGEAINTYKQAIHLRPESEWGYYHLALAYIDVKDKESALSLYEKLITMAENTRDEERKATFNKLAKDILQRIQQ